MVDSKEVKLTGKHRPAGRLSAHFGDLGVESMIEKAIAVINGCKTLEHTLCAKQWLDILRSRGMVGRITYNTVIAAWCDKYRQMQLDYILCNEVLSGMRAMPHLGNFAVSRMATKEER